MACKNKNRESILDRIDQKEHIFKKIPKIKIQRECDHIMFIKKGYITLRDKLKMYYEVVGVSDGIPIILLPPGPGGTHHYYHPYFEQSLKKRHKIIYFDPIGTGLSDYATEYSVEDYLKDLEELREYLDVKKWVVFGWSFGGLIAQIYETKYPAVFLGKILVASALNFTETIDKFGQFGSKYQRYTKKDLQLHKKYRTNFTKLDQTNKNAVDIHWFNFNHNVRWKQQQFYKPSIKESVADYLFNWVSDTNYNSAMYKSAQVASVGILNKFSSQSSPTLVCDGKYDTIGGSKKLRIMKKIHPNAKCVLFMCSSHDIFVSETKKFFRIMNEFIRSEIQYKTK